jgi:simple sugar transport system permease protein
MERRGEPRFIGPYRVLAIIVGLAIALLLAPILAGVSASEFYDIAWTGTLGSSLGQGNVLTVAVPLAIAGLAASIPYRLGLWNIGIDGQILMGAWLALAVSMAFPDLAGPLLIPLMLIAGMIGGALWMLGPALARAYLGLNEIVTTFLLNFVAAAWLTYWVTGPWRDPAIAGGGIRSEPVPEQSQLGLLDLGGAQVHWGIVIAVALPVAAWATMRFSRFGYEVVITGASERAGGYAGIGVQRRVVTVMLTGGALGGLAGVVDMLGTLHQYGSGLSNSTGFSAVVIAVLAGGSELAVPIMAFVYAILVVGGDAVGLTGVSSELVFALVGITLLLATMGDALARFRLVRTRGRKSSETDDAPPTPQAGSQVGAER